MRPGFAELGAFGRLQVYLSTRQLIIGPLSHPSVNLGSSRLQGRDRSNESQKQALRWSMYSSRRYNEIGHRSTGPRILEQIMSALTIPKQCPGPPFG